MTSNPMPKHGEHRPGTVGRAQGSVQVRVCWLVPVCGQDADVWS